MTLAERQTTGDEVSPNDDRRSNNAGHADRLDNVRGESGIDNHLLALIRGCLDGVPKSLCSIEKVIQERHGRISIQQTSYTAGLQSFCEVGHTGTGFLMREIVIDTETTGLDPSEGHRVVEIGAVELVNRSLTGETFHCYLCPQRVMPADAVAVHGLTGAFLADKPLFAAVADEFLVFVGDAPLVAHNAGFDIAFLNAELKGAGKPPIAPERVIDTLVLARRKHPGGHNTLDDLCSRYGVNSLRSKHGALLDAELLAAVYVELTTTRQA